MSNGGKMEHVMFVQKVREDKKEEYIRFHKEAWRELLIEAKKAGFERQILWLSGNYVLIYSMAEKGGRLAIPKNARTWHHAAASVMEFIRKKISWSKNYSERLQKERKFKWIPEDRKGKIELMKNVLMNLSIIPNLYISIKRYNESKESAWLLHPLMAFLVTAFYGLSFFLAKI